MHHIYHTHAVILHARPVGERDMFLSLFTYEFGALSVKVTGVRTIKSKLRSALVAGSWIRADIVRGREIWRLTSAAADTSFFVLPSTARPAYARGLRLIGRLCRGEQAHDAIYDDMRIFFSLLAAGEQKEYPSIEGLFALRVLYHLGYWGDQELYRPYLTTSFTRELIETFSQALPVAIPKINQSLHETQL